VIIQGWPFQLVYESRFMLPVVVFATCATVATVLRLATPALQPVVVFLLCFIAANRLVDQAFEEKRLQTKFDGLGTRVRPFVDRTEGLVVLVTPDQTRQSPEEVSVKVAYRWSAAESNRFWIVRPWDPPAVGGFGPARRAPSSGPGDVRLPRQLWHRPRTWPAGSRSLLWHSGVGVRIIVPKPFGRRPTSSAFSPVAPGGSSRRRGHPSIPGSTRRNGKRRVRVAWLSA
jgi:hypothetical protein